MRKVFRDGVCQRERVSEWVSEWGREGDIDEEWGGREGGVSKGDREEWGSEELVI